MSSSFVVHRIGSLGGDAARADIFFQPETGSVSFHVSVPNDKRRAEIVVQAGLAALRQMMTQLEVAIESAKLKRNVQQGITATSAGIEITVTGLTLIVDEVTYRRLGELTTSGQNDFALKLIRNEFPALSEKGASELAFLIYSQLRPRE